MRKDLVYNISNKIFDTLISKAMELDLPYYIKEGVLLDNCIIYNEGAQQIRIGRGKPRKYILVEVVYRTTWTSDLILTLTDSDTKANDFMERVKMFENEVDYIV